MKMFKKITSAALAAAMMLTSGAAFAAFKDVDIENTDRESVAINVVTGNANFASQRSFYTNGSEGQKFPVEFKIGGKTVPNVKIIPCICSPITEIVF